MNLLLFDCDSTLSAIEGIDELGRLRGAAVFEKIQKMTNDAMNGGVALEDIFARRLELIQPAKDDIEKIAQLYITHATPDATGVIQELRRDHGWTPMIVSGGFRQAILPFAEKLGIARVEAVDIFFNENGTYRDFDHDAPTARAHGKNEIIAKLKREFSPEKIVMVGDGASDLETAPDVDLFVGFGGHIVREKIKDNAGAFIYRLSELKKEIAG